MSFVERHVSTVLSNVGPHEHTKIMPKKKHLLNRGENERKHKWEVNTIYATQLIDDGCCVKGENQIHRGNRSISNK